MMKPTRWRKWLYLAMALVAVVLSSMLHGPLVETRDKWSLRPAMENFPPSLVLGTQMLGSFRGMLVVGLWMRATELQEQGRYYELMQLYEWITQLEPRLESVWTHSAWNLAYNISVAFETGEDRWRWVMNGVRQLRDRGLVMNPRSYLLNRELAWIFFHKIGATSDEQHPFYKRELAKALHVILGGPTPDYEALAAAPRAQDELLADAAVSSLVERVRAAGFDPLRRDIAWLNDASTLPEAAAPIVEAAKGTPAFDALDAFLRARALREGWRLDAAKVKAIVDEHGPVDFRVPWAHALYWATESLEHVKATENPIHGERLIYNSLVQMFETGRLLYYPETRETYWMPDVRFADAANEAFLKEIEATEGRGVVGPKSTHRYWLRNAIVALYLFGDKEKAAEFYRQVRELYPREDYPPSVEGLVVKEIREDLERGQLEQVAGFIRGYIRQGYSWLAAGSREASDGHLAMAKSFYLLYQAKAAPRLQLPPWEVLLKQALEGALDPQRGLPKEVRDRLREMLNLPPEEEAAPEEEPEGESTG
jgi:tetratricopeptide (TPR) repeat protein